MVAILPIRWCSLQFFVNAPPKHVMPTLLAGVHAMCSVHTAQGVGLEHSQNVPNPRASFTPIVHHSKANVIMNLNRETHRSQGV